MSETIIEATGLKKYFEQSTGLVASIFGEGDYVKAIDGVDLTIERGESVGLVGESGCGKTTLCETVLGLQSPSEGTVRFKGEDISEMDKGEIKQLRKDAQIIFQNPLQTLNPRLTVRNNLEEPLKIHDVCSKDRRLPRVEDAIENVGLNPSQILSRFPSELSGGQRQRVSIARLFLLEPDFIVADEPVSMLDVSVRTDILDLLDEYIAENDAAMLYISHDLSTVAHVCERMSVMYLGRFVESGATRDVIASPRHPYTQLLVESIPSIDATREKIKDLDDLETGVTDPPSATDVPPGCRFHTRCPKVIPPDHWDASQELYRRVFQLSIQIRNGSVESELQHMLREDRQGETVPDDEQIDMLYDEYVGGELPPEVERVVTESLADVVAGDQDAAVERLEERFGSVCRQQTPRVLPVNDGHAATCHLYDPEVEPARQAERVN